MLNFHRSSRAVANPVTMIILLAIIILGVIAVYYIWNTTAQRSGNAVQIQSIAFQDDQTRVYVQNIGRGTVNLDMIYLGNEGYSVRDANCTVDKKGSTRVDEGQTAEITVNRVYVNKIHIKVVCSDGTFYEGDWEP